MDTYSKILEGYRSKVKHYIKLGTIDDLNGMAELALDISTEMIAVRRKRKDKETNMELSKVASYKEWRKKIRKDNKPYTDEQAKMLGKEQAIKAFNFNREENDYYDLWQLLSRLLEKKIEVQSINKQLREAGSHLGVPVNNLHNNNSTANG